MNQSARMGLMLSGWMDPKVSMVEQTAGLLARVPLVREQGFSSVWVGQHILADPWPMLDTTAMLGRITGVADGMEVGGIYLLPLSNPVRLAESLLSLDVLSGGQFVLGAAMGWRRHEFEILGVPIDERVGRFVETLEILQRLWNENEAIDYEGQYFQLRGARLAAAPIRPGGIPVWIGASSEGGVRRAVRSADTWFASAHTPMPLLRKLVGAFDEAVAELGVAPTRRPILRHCMVAESESAAIAALESGLEGYYGAFRDWGLFSDVIGQSYTAERVGELVRGRVIFGDPEACLQQFREYMDLGFNEFVLHLGLPGVDEASVQRSIGLLGQEILPRLAGSGP